MSDSLGEVKFIGFEIILKPVSCTFRAFNVLNVTWGRLNLGEVTARKVARLDFFRAIPPKFEP